MLVLYIRFPINFIGTRVSLIVPSVVLNSFSKFTFQLCSYVTFIHNKCNKKIKSQVLLIFIHYTHKYDLIEDNWTAHMSKTLASWFVSDAYKMVSTFHHSCHLIKASIFWREKAEYKRFLCQTGESLEQVYGFRLKKPTGTCAMLQFIWYVQGTIITNTGMSAMCLPTRRCCISARTGSKCITAELQ